MKKYPMLLSATALILAAGAPAFAQDNTTASDPGNAAAAASPPQPTEKEAKDLARCKRMTAQQRAQSSKCGDLMAKFGIGEKKGDDLMSEQALGR